MLLGYNTSGFTHHRVEDALQILADLGYRSVALTLDQHVLNPFEPDLLGRTAHMRRLLETLGLRCVIETGARFLLDARRKHQPTLISPLAQEREHRLDFLRTAVDIALELGADAVSFWSGTATDQAGFEEWSKRLVDGCKHLGKYAGKKNVRLAFEPEPGMLIDNMDKFAVLRDQVALDNFGLTLDIGHLHCQGEVPIADHVRRWKDWLWNVHIEDMRRGVHEHLMFGEGEIDFPPVLAALREVGYQGGVHVELSRHSHDAVRTAEKAAAFLRPLM